MNKVVALAGPFDARPWVTRAERITGDISGLQGFGGTPVCLLAEAMVENGSPLLVVTLDPGLTTDVMIEGRGFKICVGPYRPRSRDRWMDAFAKEQGWIYRFLARERPTLVHAHWTYEYALGTLDSGLPNLITSHDAPLAILKFQALTGPKGLPYRTMRTLMAYRALRRARSITAVSSYVVDHLHRYRFTRGPIQVVPNGLPDICFQAPARENRVGEGVTFVAILNGGFTGLKNGPILLSAFHRFLASGHQARLVLFGHDSGPGEKAWAMAAELGIQGAISFRGLVPHGEVLRFLRQEGAGILVHPSLQEANPMSVLEAMAHGLPVIAGRWSGGVAEVVQHGCNGLLVDVRSPEAVAQAMMELAKNRDFRLKLGDAGHRHTFENFHMRSVLDRYLSIYSEILRQPKENQLESRS